MLFRFAGHLQYSLYAFLSPLIICESTFCEPADQIMSPAGVFGCSKKQLRCSLLLLEATVI
jgi:hypothetical protein